MTNSGCGCKSSASSCAPSGIGGSSVNMQVVEDGGFCRKYNSSCQEIESMTYEGGSDVFTSNRHALHNNEAKSFNMMAFRTQDDAPFFTPRPQARAYISATVPSGKDECQRVTNLMLRSNIQVISHGNHHHNYLCNFLSGSNMLQRWHLPDLQLREASTMSKLERFCRHQPRELLSDIRVNIFNKLVLASL